MNPADLRERRFEGLSAVVTGASRGLGQAVALELARLGATLALVARHDETLGLTAKQIEADGGIARCFAADLADPAERAGLIDQISAHMGMVDILINNAAVVWPLGPSVSVDPEEYARALSTNITAVASLSIGLLPGMMRRGRARIVNVSSGVVERPDAMIGASAYATSKAAVEGHTLNLAAELTGTGITVNAFRPGMVDTSMQAWIRAQDPKVIGADLHHQFRIAHDNGWLISAEESAQALIEHLHGDETGEIWTVNAGPVQR